MCVYSMAERIEELLQSCPDRAGAKNATAVDLRYRDRERAPSSQCLNLMGIRDFDFAQSPESMNVLSRALRTVRWSLRCGAMEGDGWRWWWCCALKSQFSRCGRERFQSVEGTGSTYTSAEGANVVAWWQERGTKAASLP